MSNDTIIKHGQIATKNLRKIVASKGKSGGTFYFVTQNGANVSGIAILLDKKDPKGKLVKGAGTELKGSISGGKFSLGTCRMENNKLVFRIQKGSISESAMKKGFKAHFSSKELKPLEVFLRRAVIKKGQERVLEGDEGEAITEKEMSDLQKNLLADLDAAIENNNALTPKEKEKARERERAELTDIFNTQDTQQGMVTKLNLVFVELIEEDNAQDYEDEELVQLLEGIEQLYDGMHLPRKRLLEMSEKLAARKIDLAEFENRASVGNRIPEPIRSQILLSKQVMDLESQIQEEHRAFPTNIRNLMKDIQASLRQSRKNIVAELADKVKEEASMKPPKKDFANISKFIDSPQFLEGRPEKLAKMIQTLQRYSQKKVLHKVCAEIETFETFLMISGKIQACDTYCTSADIRGTVLPKLAVLKRILETRSQQIYL